MIYTKDLKQKYDVDIFIAGGGPAGVSAAVTAARLGKRVYIAEREGYFGGAATAALVPTFAPFGDGVNVLASGIGYEIRKRVSKEYPLDSYWTPIAVEELKRAYDDVIQKSGVQFSFFTTVCDVTMNGDRIDSVVLSSKSGLFSVKAKIYIDCTGDGDLCAFAGGQFELGDEDGMVMPTTLCSLWSNIDFGKIDETDFVQRSMLDKAFSDGVFTFEDRHLPGIVAICKEKGVGGGNVGHVFRVNPTDEVSLSQGMIMGRKNLLEYERYYKEYLHGYENMMLAQTGTTLGIRESRRIVCDYTLSAEDFVKRAVFEDEIGRYCYPVDIHVMSPTKAEYDRFLKEYEQDYVYDTGESYGIPYRSLIPVSFSNVLVAGRCIGSDRKMQSSVRVMPGCYITGQAAGAAAALAVDTEDVRKISIPALQETLIRLGAYLPNVKCGSIAE